MTSTLPGFDQTVFNRRRIMTRGIEAWFFGRATLEENKSAFAVYCGMKDLSTVFGDLLRNGKGICLVRSSFLCG